MKQKFHRTKCNVKLQKSIHHKDEYYLFIEAYPVFVENTSVPQRKKISLNRTITTPIWDKDRPTRGRKHLPKRNVEGVIQCRSDADKEACKLAHKYCQMKQTDYDNQAMFPEQYRQKKEADRKADMNFIDYLRKLIKRRSATVGLSCTSQWEIMLQKIEDFADGQTVRFGDLTPQWLDDFRNYLITKKNENGKALSPNSQKLYLSKLKSALICAYKEEITPTDLSLKMQSIKGEKSKRVSLTQAELQALANTPCKSDETKRASLFSALTGLRHSDIKKLTWGEISINDNGKPRLEFRQKKTNDLVSNEISKQALNLCGKRQEPDSLIFPNLLRTEHINEQIRPWIKAAGITKHISFHCFRHTFATLQISGGTDIYVVSKLLGHTNVTTTQLYADVVDEKKGKAANTIKLKIK
ncbi:MAG: site-specific integrase [Bacteroidales bacterium]|nr:site-specific integrase [Bacteroidales bacterium]